MRVFIKDGNKEKKQIDFSPEVLSDSFLNFSDVYFKPADTSIFSEKTNDEDILTKYASEKAIKKIDCLFMMKVNDEMLKNRPTKSFDEKLKVFERNDLLISENLDEQVSNLRSRIKQRKINSILKGEFKS